MAAPSIWDYIKQIATNIASIAAGTPTSLGQKTMAESEPVVIASDQTAIPVSGTVAVTDGATSANQVLEIAQLTAINANTDNLPTVIGQAAMAASLPVAIASNQSAVPVSGTVAVTQSTSPWVVSGTAAVTQTTSPWVVSGTVTAGSDVCATSAFTRTASSASSVTVLSLNANRKKAIIYNDSTVGCYLKFGSTASATSYTYRMESKATLIEQGPALWTGIVTAIWDSATGNMQVTELTT